MFKWLKRLMWFFLLLSSLGIAAVAAFYFHLEKDLPDVSTLKDTTWETPLRVYSADGKLMSVITSYSIHYTKLYEALSYFITLLVNGFSKLGVELIPPLFSPTKYIVATELNNGIRALIQNRNNFV